MGVQKEVLHVIGFDQIVCILRKPGEESRIVTSCCSSSEELPYALMSTHYHDNDQRQQ